MTEKKNQNFDDFISSEAKNLHRHQPPEKLWAAIETRLIAKKAKLSFWENVILWFQSKNVFNRTSSLKLGTIGLATAFAILLIFYTVHEQDPMKKIHNAEKKYIEAIENLEKLADNNAENLDLTLWALYQERLNLLDESIASCKQTIEKNNGNVNAQKYLFLAYQEKVSTLKKIANFKKGRL